MARKRRNRKKPGPHELLKAGELLDRYKALKQFYEMNWGRIGLDLRKVRKPDDVRRILKSVSGIEWWRPFRDHPAKCLIADGSIEVEYDELKRARVSQKEAEKSLNNSWTEYHTKHQKLEESKTAFKQFFPDLIQLVSTPFLFSMAYVLVHELRLEELTIRCAEIEKIVPIAQKQAEELGTRLLFQEAWYARDQLCKFARSDRYDKTAINFAKATAGMPEYGWLHSLRRCDALKDDSFTSLYYQIFELVRTIVMKMRRVNVNKSLSRLKRELLKDDGDRMLRSFISPNWAFMEQAFAECRGKGFKRSELAYKIMGRFLDHVERPKTSAESELAKRNQLVPEIK